MFLLLRQSFLTLLLAFSFGSYAQFYTVMNTNDSGAGSLREGLETSGASNIVFSPALAGSTINVTSGVMTVANDVVIDGQTNDITIDAGGSSQILYSNGNNLTVNNLTLTGGNAGTGGAIGIEGGGVLTMNDCLLYGNNGWSNGGAVYTFSVGTHIFTNVSFIANTGGWGGGIYKLFGASKFYNCTFEGNAMGSGGAAFLRGGTDEFINCTIANNFASSQGGALWVDNVNVTIKNSIFYGNETSSNSANLEAFFEVAANTADFNIETSIIEGSGGSGTWNASFGTDNGGNLDVYPEFVLSVPATSAPTTAGIYELVYGSPAQNTGNNASVVGTTDVIGNGRIFYGTVDRGAYELCRTSDTINVVDCYQFNSPGGNVYTTSGTFQDTLVNLNGCDSIIVIYLQLNNTTNTLTETHCETYTVPSGDETYTASGVYMDTIPNTLGCDSILTINLTILNNTYNTISPTACDSYLVPSGSYSITSTGSYNDTIPNSVGCDSVITINATINYQSTNSFAAFECDSMVSPSGLYTWYTSGSHNDTLTNSVGCDSVITVILTIGNTTYNTLNPVVCETYTSPGGTIYTVSGNYQDTIPNSVGCDSVITINLTVNQHSTSTITPWACDTYLVPSGSYSITSTGTYMDTIPNSVGCDSVITINANIQSQSNNTINPVICNSYVSPSGNYTWTTSGSYQDTLSNTAGCDSVLTINLTIVTTSYNTISPVVCETYTSPSGSYIWTSSGTYNDTIPNSFGCDSVITINLTILNNTSSTINPVQCNSYTSPSGNNTWTISGTYQDIIPNAAGCDSIITINLTIPTPSITIDTLSCSDYVSPSGLYTWNQTGTYYDTLSSVLGCDSVITINLEVVDADAFLFFNGAELSTDYLAGSFSWIWCDSVTIISDVTPYIPDLAGDYALIVDAGICVDTSACVGVNKDYTSLTGFSPNGDGVNDVLKLPIVDDNNTVSIFNRWGDEIITIDGYNNFDVVWDGTDKSGNIVSGTYYYVISGSVTRVGWVQLLK